MSILTPLPELTPILKQLRLSGLLESLETRNREAIENKLTYPEFLALMIQDEAARRDQKKYALRLRRSGFRGDKTLEGFDFNFNPGLNQELINELARCGFVDEKVAVLIAGPCGTGKSHLAQAIGHCAVRAGVDVMFTTQSNLLSQINAARATGNIERKLQTLTRVPLLIIDLCDVASYVELAAQSGAQANSGRIVLNINDVVDHSVYLSIVPIWRLLCSPNFSRRYIVDTNNQRSRLILRISRLGCWQRATRATIPAITCSDFAKRSRAVST